jgi:deazaflavin-dependent oxidoreductase (nitroreductase family)
VSVVAGCAALRRQSTARKGWLPQRRAYYRVVSIDPSLGEEDYCYLTTTGRTTGEPRTIEIWFALDDDRLYMLSGGRDRSNWVKNLLRTAEVSVRIGTAVFGGHARVAKTGEEDERARRQLFDKYTPRYDGDLENWRQTALPIVVELES